MINWAIAKKLHRLPVNGAGFMKGAAQYDEGNG
jgi:hypothetical protein